MTSSSDLFKQIGETVSGAGKEGIEKAKEFRDSTRLSLEIRDRESSIQKAYRELGKAYYMDHRNDEDPEYDQIVFIRAAFEEIGELKANKDEVRGIRRCPNCGEPIQSGANFCPKCGAKYETDEEIAEDADESVEAAADAVGAATD